MSSPKYASPLVLKPNVSRYFIGLFLIGHVGAMLVVFSLSLSTQIKVSLMAVLFVSLIVVLKGGGLAGVRSLTWKDSGDWVIELADETQYESFLLPSSYKSPWLVVLNFAKNENQRSRSIVLFRDALDPDSFRRLRVRLGMESPEKP